MRKPRRPRGSQSEKPLGRACVWPFYHPGFPGGSAGKESACNAGDLGSNSGLGRSPKGGHGNPLQCSCLENPTDRGAWEAIVHGVAESNTTERLTLEHGDRRRGGSFCWAHSAISWPPANNGLASGTAEIPQSNVASASAACKRSPRANLS